MSPQVAHPAQPMRWEASSASWVPAEPLRPTYPPCAACGLATGHAEPSLCKQHRD